MKRISGALSFLFAFLFFTSWTAHAALINYDTNIFQDTTSGLYWYQPGYFAGDTLAEVDAFLAANSNWHMATFNELWALAANYALPTDTPLSTYLGEPTETVSWDVDYRYWYGYYDDSTWNYASLSERSDLPGRINTVSQYLYMQNPSIGAWVYSTTVPSSAPVPEPATLLLLGSGIIGFAGFRKKMKK